MSDNTYNEMEIDVLRYVRSNPFGAFRLYLPPECFLHHDTRKAIEVLTDLHRHQINPVPSVLRGRGVANQLVDLIKLDPPLNTPADELAKLLRERYTKVTTADSLESIIGSLRNGVSATMGLARIDEVKANAMKYLVGDDQGENLVESQEAYFKRLKESSKDQSILRLHLPMVGLRKKTASISPNILVALAAYPSFGKTSLLELMAESWAKEGYNGIYFNFEEEPQTMRQRRVAHYSGVPVILQDYEEEHPNTLKPEQLQAIDKANAHILSWPGNIQYVQCAGWTAGQIIATCQRLNDRRPWPNKKPIHFIIIDYLGLLGMPEGNLNRTIVYEQALLDWKNAGIHNNWATVVAAQFDKASTSKEYPNLTDVLYAGSPMSQFCKIGLIIDRKVSDDGGTLMPRGQIRVVKSNKGTTGPVPVNYIGQRMTFEEVAVGEN